MAVHKVGTLTANLSPLVYDISILTLSEDHSSDCHLILQQVGLAKSSHCATDCFDLLFNFFEFLLRDAASAVYAMILCLQSVCFLSVCLSVSLCHKSVFY